MIEKLLFAAAFTVLGWFAGLFFLCLSLWGVEQTFIGRWLDERFVIRENKKYLKIAEKHGFDTSGVER